MDFKIKSKTIYLILLVLFVNSVAWFFYDWHQARKNDCFPIDQVKFLDAETIDNEEYLLVRIISGWHDKVVYLELFQQEVRFDSCGKPNRDPLHTNEIYYGPEKGPNVQWPKKFEIKNKQILISYTKEKEERRPIVDIPVLWHQSN